MTDEHARKRCIAIMEDLDKVSTKKEFERKRKAFEIEAEPATELSQPTVHGLMCEPISDHRRSSLQTWTQR